MLYLSAWSFSNDILLKISTYKINQQSIYMLDGGGQGGIWNSGVKSICHLLNTFLKSTPPTTKPYENKYKTLENHWFCARNSKNLR